MLKKIYIWIVSKIESVMLLYDKALKTTILLPFARIERESYLYNIFSPKYPAETIRRIIDLSPARCCTADELNKISRGEIILHSTLTATLSALTAIPSGIAIIPFFIIDIVQFQIFTFLISQKLIYLNSDPKEIGLTEDNLPDGLMFVMTTIMIGKQKISRMLKSVSGGVIKKVIQRYTSKIVARITILSAIRQSSKWLGLTFTKEGLEIGSEVLVIILCAFVSGLISFWLFYPMAKNLFTSLKKGITIKVTEAI